MAVTFPSPLISSKVISNLDTYNFTVNTTAPHVVSMRISDLPPSGLTITIKQNGSTIATSAAPTAAQLVVQLSATIPCTSGDTLSVVLASASASDSALNAFKGILNIHQGSSN